MPYPIDERRKELLAFLKARGEEYARYYRGRGALAPLRRLIRYPDKFIVRVLSKSRVLSLNTMLRAKTFWGQDLWVLARDKNAAPLYYFGVLPSYERKLTSFFITHIEPNDFFYDIGASYGFYTVLAEALITNGEIHSFEPLPSVFHCLWKTTEKSHRNVRIHNLAFSNTSGLTTFYDGFSQGEHSGASTMVEKVVARHPERYRRIHIEAVRLDDFVKGSTPPTIIKLDVEGGEAAVLEGGEHVIRTQMPCVVMEIWGGKSWDSISYHAVKMLIGWGYAPYLIDEDGNAHKVNESQLKEEVDRVKYDNVVFMR